MADQIERELVRGTRAQQLGEVRWREVRVRILAPEGDGRVLARATQLVVQAEEIGIA